jgi:hypothetical protein
MAASPPRGGGQAVDDGPRPAAIQDCNFGRVCQSKSLHAGIFGRGRRQPGCMAPRSARRPGRGDVIQGKAGHSADQQSWRALLTGTNSCCFQRVNDGHGRSGAGWELRHGRTRVCAFDPRSKRCRRPASFLKRPCLVQSCVPSLLPWLVQPRPED